MLFCCDWDLLKVRKVRDSKALLLLRKAMVQLPANAMGTKELIENARQFP